MSTTYVAAEVRRLVRRRAEERCEYCRIHESDTLFGCEVDHVISEKHGGVTSEVNLAYACFFCNRNKGSDLGSLAPQSGELTRFFNPRIDMWPDHFRLAEDGITIIPLTAIGMVTARILGFNIVERLMERRALQELGRYPAP